MNLAAIARFFVCLAIGCLINGSSSSSSNFRVEAQKTTTSSQQQQLDSGARASLMDQAAPFFSISKDGKTSARRIQQEQPSRASGAAAEQTNQQDANQLLATQQQQQDDFISSTAKSIFSPTQEKIELDNNNTGAGIGEQQLDQQDELVMQRQLNQRAGGTQFTMATGVPLSTPSSLSMSLDGMILNSRPRATSQQPQKQPPSGAKKGANKKQTGGNSNKLVPAAESVQTRMSDFATDLPLIEVSSNPNPNARFNNLNSPKQQQQAKASRRVPFSGNPFSSPATKGQRTKPKASNQEQQFLANNNQLLSANDNQQFRQSNNQFRPQMIGGVNSVLADTAAAEVPFMQQELQSFDDQQQQQQLMADNNLSRGTANELELMRSLLSNPSVMKEAQLESLPPQNVNPDDMIMSVMNSPDGKERRLIMIARDTLDNLQKIANQQAARSSSAQTSGQTKGTTKQPKVNKQQQQQQQQQQRLQPTELNNWWPATTNPPQLVNQKATAASPGGDFVQQTITTTTGSPNELLSSSTPSGVSTSSTSSSSSSSELSDLDGTTTETAIAKKQNEGGDNFREIPVTQQAITSTGSSSGSSQQTTDLPISTTSSRSTSPGADQIKPNQNQKQSQIGDSPLKSSKQTSAAAGGKTNKISSSQSPADGGQVQQRQPASPQKLQPAAPTKGNNKTTGSNGNGKKKSSSNNGKQPGGQKSASNGKQKLNGNGQGAAGATKTATKPSSSPSMAKQQQQNNANNRTNGQQLASRVFDQQTTTTTLATDGLQQQPAAAANQMKSTKATAGSGASPATATDSDSSLATTTKGTPTATTQSPTSSSAAPSSRSMSSQSAQRNDQQQLPEISRRLEQQQKQLNANENSGRGLGSGSTANRLAQQSAAEMRPRVAAGDTYGDDGIMADISPDELRKQEQQQQEDELFGRESGLTGLDSLRGSIPGEPTGDYPVYDIPPKTSFSCQSQSCPAGYYADLETQCQVFHICQSDGRYDTFLCPNGTIFSQQHFVCVWWWQVDCQQSASFYKLNDAIYCNSLSSRATLATNGTTTSPPSIDSDGRSSIAGNDLMSGSNSPGSSASANDVNASQQPTSSSASSFQSPSGSTSASADQRQSGSAASSSAADGDNGNINDSGQAAQNGPQETLSQQHLDVSSAS